MMSVAASKVFQLLKKITTIIEQTLAYADVTEKPVY